MKLVTKYQISSINSCREKCNKKYLGTDRGKTVYPPSSGGAGIKKATCVGVIPAEVVKNNKPIVVPQLTSLINLSIGTGVFPNRLKGAQVTPLHKEKQCT